MKEGTNQRVNKWYGARSRTSRVSPPDNQDEDKKWGKLAGKGWQLFPRTKIAKEKKDERQLRDKRAEEHDEQSVMMT